MTTVERMQLLSGVLGCVALAIAGMALLALVANRWFSGRPRTVAFHSSVLGAAPVLALGVAATSTAGSLYFSEVAGYVPCNLCWYQRIAMYSAALILAVSVVMRDRAVAPYVLALALAGLVISAYHYVVEWNPSLETDVCSLDVPCTTIWFRQFEFMSLPFLAGCGFLALVSLMCVVISGRSSAPVTVDVGRSVDDD